MHTPDSHTASADDLERLARKRAGMRMGWLTHAIVFASVNIVLAAISVAGGRHWAVFPFLAWGLGLAIHGLAVFLASGGFGLQERLIQQERARLAAGLTPYSARGRR